MPQDAQTLTLLLSHPSSPQSHLKLGILIFPCNFEKYLDVGFNILKCHGSPSLICSKYIVMSVGFFTYEYKVQVIIQVVCVHWPT